MFKNIKTIQDLQKRLLKIFSIIILLILMFLISNISQSQVIISTNGVYTQDFGNTDITSWTNNSTFLGWYSTHTLDAINGHINVTNSPPINNGGFYSYECNGDNNQKIGTRPSNSVPGPPGNYLRYGVRFKNNSGQTITRIRVTFTAYQFSLAENDGVINRLEFHYRISSSAITDLTSGTYTSVPQLWYELPNNDYGGGNNSQILGYPCTVDSTLSECLNVTINEGDEIMLRWSDKNDSNNDHHNGIDNVIVEFFTNAPENSSTCVSPLPIILSDFTVKKVNDKSIIKWTTLTEINNDYFIIERSTDGKRFEEINKTKGSGNSNQTINYQFVDYRPKEGINYYRLKQVDFDGTYSYSEIKVLNFENNSVIGIYYYENHLYIKSKETLANTSIEIYNLSGQLISSINIISGKNEEKIEIPNLLGNGVYFANVINTEFQKSFKFIVSK